MGTIIYKPHCGKCGAIINQKVRYREIDDEIVKNRLYGGYYIDIEPNRCAHCGNVFGTIEIPIPKVNNGNDD